MLDNATTNCTGDPGKADAPGKRVCSAQVIMAPVEAFFNNNPGWGLLYIPL